jgi:hypothetical protein|tara:strand:+ start:445 stop:1011 length:567 start_codon:yes stop_codon:yes gene_type:complete
MANKDAAFGFRPTRSLVGGELRTEEYAIAANHGTSIFTGQVVEAVAGGGIEQAAAGDTQQVGVFGGCFFTDPSTSKPTFKAFYPASTNASDIKATVHVDPFTVFEAQHDGTGTAAMNNSAFDFVGTSGSTITGQSTSEIDTSTSGTSGGFKQIGISTDPENSDTSSANVNAYVVFNTGEHVFKLTTGV